VVNAGPAAADVREAYVDGNEEVTERFPELTQNTAAALVQLGALEGETALIC